jgi:hypothetical protein
MSFPEAGFSDLSPKPLRCLVLWPDNVFHKLERRMRDMIRIGAITLDQAQLDELRKMLKLSGYYHVLAISAQAFQELKAEQQVKYLRKISLVYLAPGATSKEIVGRLVTPAVYFDSEWDLSLHINLLVGICTALVNAKPIMAALSYPWVESGTLPSGLSMGYTGQNNRIWPVSGQTNQDTTESAQLGSTSSVPLKPALPSGGRPQVFIQNAETVVNGTLIQQTAEYQTNIIRDTGSKTTIQQNAKGDQVNLNKTTTEDIEIQQTAGRNQMNINRSTGEWGSIKQTAGEDQVNINRISQAHTRRCPSCNFEQDSTLRECLSCGKEIRSN